MLDEPASGLTHSEVGDLGRLIRELRDDYDLTVLLVEHHMNMVMSISEKVVVMDFGRKIAEGAPDDVPPTTRGDRGLPGDDRVSRLLEAHHLTGGYGPVQVLRGSRLPGGRGRGRRHPRRQRGRQDHDAPSDLGDDLGPGRVTFAGTSLVGRKPEEIVRLGVAHVPQGRGTIADLTVDENLRVGAYIRRDGEVEADIDRWYETFPRLARAPGPDRRVHERW